MRFVRGRAAVAAVIAALAAASLLDASLAQPVFAAGKDRAGRHRAALARRRGPCGRPGFGPRDGDRVHGLRLPRLRDVPSPARRLASGARSAADVKIVYVNFPLAQHLRSFHGSEAALCAGLVGGLRGIHRDVGSPLQASGRMVRRRRSRGTVFTRYAKEGGSTASRSRVPGAGRRIAADPASDLETANKFEIDANADVRVPSARRHLGRRCSGASAGTSPSHSSSTSSHRRAQSRSERVREHGRTSGSGGRSHCTMRGGRGQRFTNVGDGRVRITRTAIDRSGRPLRRTRRRSCPTPSSRCATRWQSLIGRDDLDVVLLSGGTGLGARDRTVEAVQAAAREGTSRVRRAVPVGELPGTGRNRRDTHARAGRHRARQAGRLAAGLEGGG